ncbi:MAG: SGNH/GDSL hydrolase family protein [Porphyromonadaceae bacterium]|nr:MAG: SGNH/GDSL hydrolase family protein [Porphyromonadaceae bacterium]
MILWGVVALMSVAAPKLKFYDAQQFTLVGKLMPGTFNPYHRIDTVKYKGFDKKELLQVRESAGMSIAFKTSSRTIAVRCEFGDVEWPQNSTGIAAHGFDLYIKKMAHGAGLVRAHARRKRSTRRSTSPPALDGTEHECLLYLPLFAEVNKLEIGVDADAPIAPSPNPFRHRIAIFGSSFTHGTSTSRPGLTYPAHFCRMTGLQLLGLGCSGHSKLQPYFAEALADVDADAFIFDSFSNPTAKEIKERLFPFIERLQKAHPGKPLIFQQTIDREYCAFNTARAKSEAEKKEMAETLMAEAVKKYKDVYFIHPNATSPDHEASVDGIHPTNYGYTLWAKSIVPQVLEILAKYGIK